MQKIPSRETVEWISPAEAANIVGVSSKTLASLADDGQVHAIKLPSGHRRYDRSSVEALAEGGGSK